MLFKNLEPWNSTGKQHIAKWPIEQRGGHKGN